MFTKNKEKKLSDAYCKVGRFIFSRATSTLKSDEKTQKLEPQVGELLSLLIENAGQVVSRDLMTTTIWPNRVVSDDALRATVKKLREALQDDARNPSYIKTHPLKGYSLVAPVSHKPTQNKQDTAKIIGAMVIISALLLLSFGIAKFISSPPHKTSKTIASLTSLTNMSGSEVSPDYDPNHNRLVFSHRANKDDYLQLYVKSLNTQQVIRLTWEQANYANALWSFDGNNLVYTRSNADGLTHYLSRFDANNGIVEPKQLNHQLLNNKYLLAWSKSGKSIYLKDALRPNEAQGIWRYDLEQDTLVEVTSPNVKGGGDFFVRESADGQMLAFLRSIQNNKRELLILHLPTGSLLHTRILPKAMDSLSWRADGRQITLSSFNGDLLEFNLDNDKFQPINTNLAYLNDVFYQCGSRCYFMRRHNGNYQDLAEQPNPFSRQKFLASGYFELSGADDFPLYGNSSDGIYFVSKTEQTTFLKYVSITDGVKNLKEFPKKSNIHSLSINEQETHLTGILNNRLFIFEIQSSELTYINTEMEALYPPVWDSRSNSLLYAKLEKNQPVLYRYHPATKKEEQLYKGYIAIRKVDDNLTILVDRKHRAWLVKKEQTPEFLVTLPSISPNRWQIKNNWLYFTTHDENIALLQRVNLDTGELESSELARNRFRLNFDINPSSDKLVVVKSLLASSDLVKVTIPE